MVLIPKYIAQKEDAETKRNLVNHFNAEMEKVINRNQGKDKFWVLGKVKFLPEFGGKIGRVFLDASDTKPMVVKGSFVYEVDNRSGTKTLLWTCDNNQLNIIPTKKSYPVSPT